MRTSSAGMDGAETQLRQAPHNIEAPQALVKEAHRLDLARKAPTPRLPAGARRQPGW
jgi:hypothetical protein